MTRRQSSGRVLRGSHILATVCCGLFLSVACGSSDSGTGGSAGLGGSQATGGSANGGSANTNGGGRNGGRSGSAGTGGTGVTEAGAGDEGGASEAGASEAGAAGSNAGSAGSGGTGPGNVPTYLKSPAISSFFLGLNYGSAYDSILAQPIQSLQSAIKPGSTTTPVAGQVVENYFFQQVATTSDLYSALDVSASMSVSAGAFGASAKVDYAKKKQLDSSKIYLFVDATSSGVTQQLVNPELTDSAKAMSPEDFYRNYGDRYVNEIVTGVELYGTIEIQTTSEQDKESLSSSLKVSYGPSSVTVNYASELDTLTQNHTVTVDVHAIGFAPSGITTANEFVNAITNFSAAAAGANNPTSQSLYLVYGNYYGLAGYPGVPAGTDAKVAADAQAVSDYLLYNSLVNNDFSAYFADTNYSSLPFLTGMKTYRDALNTFLQTSFSDSQSLPAPPTIAANSKIETYTTTAKQVTGTPNFVVHTLDNGFVPKRRSDYDIPLRYAHSGSINGVTFSPTVGIATSTDISLKNPVNYQLYLVDKTVAPNPQNRVLSYKWDAGTYFLDQATTGGLPDNTLIPSRLNALTVNDFHHPELGHYQFVLVNKASGEVLSSDGSSYQLFQAPLGANNGNYLQTFEFQVAGCGGGTTYAAGNAIYGYEPVKKLWFDIAYGGNADGTAVGTYGWAGCVDNQTFLLNAKDGGNMQAIAGYGGDVNVYLAVDPSNSTVAPGPNAKVITEGQSGNDNQLWRFIPAENIDHTP